MKAKGRGGGVTRFAGFYNINLLHYTMFFLDESYSFGWMKLFKLLWCTCFTSILQCSLRLRNPFVM